RLRLAARVKADGLELDSKANLIAQGWDAEGKQIHFVACEALVADSDWRDIEVVFEAPVLMTQAFVMAYLVGKGQVWWDDFLLTETDEPLTVARNSGGRSGGESGYQALARGLASDLPWTFNAEEALDRAKDEKRPILVYVRCTDDRGGLPSAFRDIRAEGIAFGDDGYAKDLLFRAGALTDRAVSAMITRRFVPLCLTYHLGTQGQGQALDGWRASSSSGRSKATVDRGVGAAAPGSLMIEQSGRGEGDTWRQSVPGVTPGSTVTLKAKVRLADLARSSQFQARIKVSGNGRTTTLAGEVTVDGVGDWRDIVTSAVMSADAQTAFVEFAMEGKGKAWIDDVELTNGEGGTNLILDGGIDIGIADDPLAVFGASSGDIVTPALLAVGPNGKVTHQLHRIGAISPDLIDRWMRDVLRNSRRGPAPRTAEDALLDGDLAKARSKVGGKKDSSARLLLAQVALREGDLDEAAKSLRGLKEPEAILQRGIVALRQGDWESGLREFRAVGTDNPALAAEAAYWSGLCEQRLGRLEAAEKTWRVVAGETPFGRKAALAVVRTGPRPWLSESVRQWPEDPKSLEQTETIAPDAFDGPATVRLLLELQRQDGS
ncbi:MAG: tetratricopeptide repeat protein, partial [Planctomycetes bacterium]|nr:tetratricopeptide repeat protein [Planctomycetota bacterium]